MHTDLPLLTFLLAVVLISASPGPAVALILRRAALGGFRGAVPTVLGLEAGLYLWALAAGAGLAALVAASEAAYLVVRVVGAVVLVTLGVRSWRAALGRRRTAAAPSDPDPELPDGAPSTTDRGRGRWASFGEALLIQLANPKAAVYTMSFYPQFVPRDRPLFATTAQLGALQIAVETCLYLGLAAVVGRARDWFRNESVRRRLEGVSGTVLIGLGLRVATSSR